MTKDLFAEFPDVTSQEWLAQIAKDLKGKAPGDLNWSPDGQLSISPFIHADTISSQMSAVRTYGTWKLGEKFDVDNVEQSHAQIHTALLEGAEALHITCPDDVEWETLLADVELPLLHLGIRIHGDFQKGVDSLMRYTNTKFDINRLHITAYGSEALANTPTIRCCFDPVSTESISEGLAQTILNAFESAKWNTRDLIRCDLAVDTGMYYLVEISRLRALRILWKNVSEALQFSIPPEFAIEAHTSTGLPEDNPYDHMIRSTVIGLAAVLGGADRIYLRPASGPEHPDAFYRHIARNIHHLLRYESKLSSIGDPVAGSYYMDSMIRDIVDNSWRKIQRQIKEAAGKH